MSKNLKGAFFLFLVIQVLGCAKSNNKASESAPPNCFNPTSIMPVGAHITAQDFIDGKNGTYTLTKVEFMSTRMDNGHETSLRLESVPFANSTDDRPIFKSSALCKNINEGHEGHFPAPYQINRKDGVILKDLQNSFSVTPADEQIVASLILSDLTDTMIQRANNANYDDDLEIYMSDLNTFKIVFHIRDKTPDHPAELLNVATYVLKADSSTLRN